MESRASFQRGYCQEDGADQIPKKERRNDDSRYPATDPEYRWSTITPAGKQHPEQTDGSVTSVASSTGASTATFSLVRTSRGEESANSHSSDEPLEAVEEGREITKEASVAAVQVTYEENEDVPYPPPEFHSVKLKPAPLAPDTDGPSPHPQEKPSLSPPILDDPSPKPLQDGCDPDPDEGFEQPPDSPSSPSEEQPTDALLEDPEQFIEDAGGELVQATLIRDIDESSDHSDADNLAPVPPTDLVRDTTSGAINIDSDMAVVEAKPVEPVPVKTMPRKLVCAVMGMLLLVIAALSVGFVVSAQRTGDSSNQKDNGPGASNDTVTPTVSPAPISSGSPTAAPIPVLRRLREEGEPLRCGVVPGPGLFEKNEDGEVSGFDAALCAAVAAAATGDPKKVEYKEVKFQNLLKKLHLAEFDIVSAGVTHTMERQVYQFGAKTGFAFTAPYLYQGMQLAGDPSLVDCADQGLEYIAACTNILVCVVDESTHQQMLSSYLPGQKLLAIESRDKLRKALANGTCNVIAHEGYNLAESLVRTAGYDGPYKVGRTLFSKEPLAMVTAADDPQFSDFANSVVESLIVAEANNITQSTANMFEETNAFGEGYKDMLKHAVAAGGNYGELYQEFLEPYSKRQGLNLINYGNSTTSGLLYSHPYGSIATEEGESGEKLVTVKRRGYLRCGIRSNRVGFAELKLDNATGALTSSSGLEIDYCRALAGSIFAADGDAIELIKVVDEQDGFAKLAAGDLDVLAGATWSFLNDVQVPGVNEGFSFTQPYFYGKKGSLAEEENLCLATKQDDHVWSSFVYWIAAAIVQAEESKIEQGMSNSMPPIYLFGNEFNLCFQDAILTSGNQREIYHRNLEDIFPRNGRNLLNGNVGAQMYPIPGLMDVEK